MENKKTNNILRKIVRFTAYPVLLIGLVWKIVIPWIKGEPLYLDVNDGYVFGGLLLVLLYMEGVKFLFDRVLNKKSTP